MVQGCESCSWLAFSDTVVIILVPESEDAFPRMLASMGYLLQGTLWAGMRRGIFFRGAASVGRFVQSGTRMLGESLEEAASWYEKPDWIGVIATPSLGHLLDENVLAGHSVTEFFVEAQVPLKGLGLRPLWAANWPARAVSVERAVGQDAHTQLLRWFRTYGGAVGPQVADKYANTLAFARDIWLDRGVEGREQPVSG